MTDKLRKYVLPNIPYVFIGWAFLKLGTAYRLAVGSDFAHKFIGLGQTVGAAFADFALPDEPEYQIGKHGRMRRSYLKEHRPILYTNLLTSGTLHRHLAEIDQACNERMAIIVSDMAQQEGVTEALKAADQMEWVRRMNSIRSRAEEIILTELVYE